MVFCSTETLHSVYIAITGVSGPMLTLFLSTFSASPNPVTWYMLHIMLQNFLTNSEKTGDSPLESYVLTITVTYRLHFFVGKTGY